MVKKANRFFVTGTDTAVGKTIVSAVLLEALNTQGFKTVAVKPVASGASHQNGELKNSDALLLQCAASVDIDYRSVNSFVFERSVAPHIAAKAKSVELNCDSCLAAIQPALNADADYLIAEGAGGWLVPLNLEETFADLACAITSNVILVVAIKLGCINHAMLSAQAIRHSGASLIGWVANFIERESTSLSDDREIISTLNTLLHAPLIGELPYIDSVINDSDIPAMRLSVLREQRLIEAMDLQPLLTC